MLDRAAGLYAGTHAEDDALEIAEAVATTNERREDVRRRHVAARRLEYERLEGLPRASAMQRAVELAKRYGLHAEAGAMLIELQELALDPTAFEAVSAQASLPTAELDAEIDRVAGRAAGNLSDALRRIGAYGPLSGPLADIDRELDAEAAQFPLQALFGRTVFGADSAVPVFIANEPANRRRVERAQRRSLSIQVAVSALIAGMLDAAEAVHGRPTHDDLADLFTTSLIGGPLAERFARALELYWDGAYDESAHVLVPRLEAALRELLRKTGRAVYKPAGEGVYGGVISLNVVMASLRELTNDDPWYCTIEAVLTEPLALNLRNSIAHGLVGEVDRVGAAVLLHIACYLACLERNTPESE